MRIVKLSTNPPTGFATLDGVRRFFFTDIRERKPPGRFDVTPGRIAQDGLVSGEALVFTYKARVVFTARVGSGLMPNEDEERQQYPSYFVVDLATLREADEDFHDVERQYNEATGAGLNLVESQGWNRIPDSIHTDGLWARLGGSSATGSRLSADEGDQAGSNDGHDYSPEGIDRRSLVERQIRERRGQGQFRDTLRKRYGDCCLVTGCQILAVLEAAHISPYRGEDDNHPENGLLLRSDIHTLFDLDLLGIQPERLRVELHPDLGKQYGRLADVTLACAASQRPSFAALRLRYERFRQRVHRPA